MEIIFAKEYLKELHLWGKTNDKKHRYQPDIVKRYRKAVNRIAYAHKIEDLYKRELSSVRVSDKYRIEFEEMSRDGQSAISICSIIELSNHYK